jgi:hypothetical protein
VGVACNLLSIGSYCTSCTRLLYTSIHPLQACLADSRIDVGPVTHQFLRDLCPDICDAWFLELGVDLRSPITLCWVVNGLPTFGRKISDDRIVQSLCSHFDETYNPFPFNKFYALLSYDLFSVFQAKQDLNPELMRRKAVDLFGLYCWRCHNFQHKGLCTCCFLVQEFSSPSITTHLSVVYVNRHGTSRTRVNPSYARSRSSVKNRSFHPTFLLPMTLSLLSPWSI